MLAISRLRSDKTRFPQIRQVTSRCQTILSIGRSWKNKSEAAFRAVFIIIVLDTLIRRPLGEEHGRSDASTHGI